MGLQVFKFGGTSVGDAQAIRTVMGHVRAAAPEVTVVLSAMSGITDLLLSGIDAALAGQLAESLAAAQRFHERHCTLIPELVVTPQRVEELLALVDAQTDEYLAICRSVAVLRELTHRTRDAAVARGERALARIFAAGLVERGLPGRFVDAPEVIFATRKLGALWPDFDRCQAAAERVLRPALAQGQILVVPGFIGTGDQGELLTLGRGGTDLTAAILGRILKAERVVLYKEVDGLMTADPRAVPEARVLPELHYREAAELAYYGAKVLHPRTIFPLLEPRIPLFIKNTFNAAYAGTRVAADVKPRSYPVTALSAISGQSLVAVTGNGMLGVPGVAGRTFGALAAAGHSVSMISQASSEASICFVVPDAEAADGARALEAAFEVERRAGLIDPIAVTPDLALVAIVGLGMRGTPGIAGRVFGALSGERINVVAIAQGASELNITVALARADVPKALLALHREFQLDKAYPLADTRGRDTAAALLGFGQIGRALTAQIAAQSRYFQSDLGLELRCVAVADRSGVRTSEGGFSTEELISLAETKAEGARVVLATRNLTGGSGASAKPTARQNDLQTTGQELAKQVFALPWRRPVLVDLTAEETLPLLRQALTRGFHLVLANKKPLAVAQREFDSLFTEARERRLLIRYEATVGAGLPILDTLAKLREAGDPVRSLWGCLSGTLGYLMTQLEEGVPFSRAVRGARALGYTEPDPREDLLGLDVGRKALILSRTLGQKRELADIRVDPLFPAELSDPDPDRFLDKLIVLDEPFARRVAAAKAARKALRYVARIEGESVRVGIEEVDEASPFGRLRGTDNQVALYTSRYAQNPLVVTGPGAGAEVTAAGVLNDLVAIASSGQRQ